MMEQQFLRLVAGVLNINPGLLKEASTAQDIPEWDSLNHWAVIGEIEDSYGVEFTMDEATEFKNLGEIYETLQQKLAAKS